MYCPLVAQHEHYTESATMMYVSRLREKSEKCWVYL